jgi:chitin disaccharide deacetylase
VEIVVETAVATTKGKKVKLFKIKTPGSYQGFFVSQTNYNTNMSAEKRKVIINADDIGKTSYANEKIIESIENGVVTSTSLMVNRHAVLEAVEFAVNREDISVGLHLDLTHDGPLRWAKILEILTWSEQKIHDEFKKQVDRFEDLMGCLPDHIDSHLHIHRLTGFWPVVLEFAKINHIPVRSVNAKLRLGISGRLLTPKGFIGVLRLLPPGTHEIICHPGDIKRKQELEVLTSQEVKDFLDQQDDLDLINWNQVENL